MRFWLPAMALLAAASCGGECFSGDVGFTATRMETLPAGADCGDPSTFKVTVGRPITAGATKTVHVTENGQQFDTEVFSASAACPVLTHAMVGNPQIGHTYYLSDSPELFVTHFLPAAPWACQSRYSLSP